MDLGAFLAPGIYPVYLADGHNTSWGIVVRRQGRCLCWLSKNESPCGSKVRLVLVIPDFVILADNSLELCLGQKATVALSGLIYSSRFWSEQNLWVVKFETMMRIL